jgi:predicted small secreted protein
MKTVSHLLLLVATIVTLTACNAGEGPSKPASTNSTQISAK